MKAHRRMEWKLKRISKHITVKEIADYLQVSSSAITLYERGDRDLLPQKASAYRHYIESKEVKN